MSNIDEKWKELEQQAKELEAKFETELGGPRGSEFEILMPADKAQYADGVVVVKLPNEAAWERFENSKMTRVDAHQLAIMALAHPDQATFNALAGKRKGLPARCAAQIAKLEGIILTAEAGK